MTLKKIVENLYVGDMESAIRACLGKLVDWIVYIGQELPRELSHNPQVPIIHIPIVDGADNIDKWQAAVVMISYCHIGDENGKKAKTLVACRAGISRSPMMVVYHLLKCPFLMNPNWNHCSFETAYNFVKERVPEMQPEQNIYNMIKEKFS